MSYGPQGQPPGPLLYVEPPKPPSYGPGPWELIQVGFWLSLGFMAGSVAVGVLIAAVLIAVGASSTAYI